ncbi:MAG: VanW family protein [Ornithinibacter sp.]
MSLETLPDEVAPQEPSPRRRRWPFVVAGALLALAAVFVMAAAWLGDRVPRGTTVSGVAVGGLSADRASGTLTAALQAAADQPVVLTSTAGRVSIAPKVLGLHVDVPATVDGLVGFSLSPATMWAHVAGGSERPVAVQVDEKAFTAAVEKSRATLDAEPVEGSISLKGGTVTVRRPETGSTTHAERTADAVRRAWPGDRTLEVVAVPVPPKVTTQELDRVREEFADVAVSGPVTVTANGRTFAVAPKAFAPAVVLAPDASGRITPRADRTKLAAVVHAAAGKAGVEVEAKDAVVTFAGRTPTVHPHVPGVELDDASLTEQVWKAISTTTRTATVATRTTAPALTTAVAKATLPKGRISSFTTRFPAGQPRVHNIELASKLINGTYIPPGGQFSMNGILGERTKAKGYIEAGIIRGGRAAKSYGGGISQVSTTIFNAAFFSGMRLDAWTPHYYYISRYPEGREATISWPDLHNKFTNTTDGGVLIQVSTTRSSITVSFWGTKKYDVTATKSARYDVVQPRKFSDPGPDCLDQSPVPGFKVDVGRIMKQGGKVVKTEKFTTNYRPEDDVTCTNPRR